MTLFRMFEVWEAGIRKASRALPGLFAFLLRLADRVVICDYLYFSLSSFCTIFARRQQMVACFGLIRLPNSADVKDPKNNVKAIVVRMR